MKLTILLAKKITGKENRILARYLWNPCTGVYVGETTKRIREYIWQTVSSKDAIMIWQKKTASGYEMVQSNKGTKNKAT